MKSKVTQYKSFHYHIDSEDNVRIMRNCMSGVCCDLTLVREEVQHGLQQEGQVAHRQAWVAHAAGRVYQLMQQTHLHCSPAFVGTWHWWQQTEGNTLTEVVKTQH